MKTIIINALIISGLFCFSGCERKIDAGNIDKGGENKVDEGKNIMKFTVEPKIDPSKYAGKK